MAKLLPTRISIAYMDDWCAVYINGDKVAEHHLDVIEDVLTEVLEEAGVEVVHPYDYRDVTAYYEANGRGLPHLESDLVAYIQDKHITRGWYEADD